MPLFNIAELSGGGATVLAVLTCDRDFLETRYKALGKTMDLAAAAAQRLSVGNMADRLRGPLSTAYMNFVLANGKRPEDQFNADEWDSALDDEVAAVYEPYTSVLSNDWLGQHTVDTRLHVEGELDRQLASFGKEVWKQLTYPDKGTTTKVLSAVGLVAEDITDFLKKFAPAAQAPMEYMPMNRVLNKIMMAALAGANILKADFALVVDDTEEFLTGQAAKRLGIDADDVEELRTAAMAGVTPDAMAALVDKGEDLPEDTANPTPSPSTPPAPTPASSPVAGTPPASPTTAAPASGAAPASTGATTAAVGTDKTPAGALPPSILNSINALGAKDDDMATLLGFSRATYNNYRKGKAPFVPSVAQKDALVGYVRDRTNDAIRVYIGLTGAPVDEVA